MTCVIVGYFWNIFIHVHTCQIKMDCGANQWEPSRFSCYRGT